MAERTKRFRVSGSDAEGDVHAFETDDKARAEDVARQMREDLNDVVLDEV